MNKNFLLAINWYIKTCKNLSLYYINIFTFTIKTLSYYNKKIKNNVIIFIEQVAKYFKSPISKKVLLVLKLIMPDSCCDFMFFTAFRNYLKFNNIEELNLINFVDLHKSY